MMPELWTARMIEYLVNLLKTDRFIRGTMLLINYKASRFVYHKLRNLQGLHFFDYVPLF
jgi:hypothetical protein